MKAALLSLIFLPALLLAQTPQTPSPEPLWPGAVPGRSGQEEPDKPALTWYPAAAPNGAAVLICPGGGYGMLAMDHEGRQIAEFFNSLGMTAVILKYRLGRAITIRRCSTTPGRRCA